MRRALRRHISNVQMPLLAAAVGIDGFDVGGKDDGGAENEELMLSRGKVHLGEVVVDQMMGSRWREGGDDRLRRSGRAEGKWVVQGCELGEVKFGGRRHPG